MRDGYRPFGDGLQDFTDYFKVVPERIRKLVTFVADWVEIGLMNPDSEARILLRSDPSLPACELAADKACSDFLMV